MSENYSVLVKNADKNTPRINAFLNVGFEKYQLPDNMVLMVDKAAPDEIKNAALDAGNGDYNAFQIALGITDE